MKQALKTSIENKGNSYEQMKVIAQAYASNQKFFAQEAIYQWLPKLRLIMVFGDVIYSNNIPENRVNIFQFQQEISEILDENEDIFKRNMFERYMDRPDEKFQNGKFALVSPLCYAEFPRYYYVST